MSSTPPTRRALLLGASATAGAWTLGCAGLTPAAGVPDVANLDREPILDPDATDRRPTTGRVDKLPRGFSWVRDRFDGLDREAALFTPTDASGKVPLLVGIHGNQGTSEHMFRSCGLGRVANDRGWYGLFPETDTIARTDPRPDWTDIRYLSALLDRVVGEHPIDRSRVWVLGFSSGGQKAYRLATWRSDLVAAIVASGSAIGFDRPELDSEWDPAFADARPVSILHLHGKKDGKVPPEGSPVEGYEGINRLPTHEALQRYATHYRAHEVSDPRPLAACPRAAQTRRWEASGGFAIHASLDPALGHTWPDYANAAAVEFLGSVPLRG